MIINEQAIRLFGIGLLVVASGMAHFQEPIYVLIRMLFVAIGIFLIQYQGATLTIRLTEQNYIRNKKIRK